MNLDKYDKPNSDKARETKPLIEDHEVKQVAKGEIQAPSKARAVGSLFFKDNLRNVGDGIVEDVILPSVNDMISEGLHSAIDMLFVGGRRRGRSSSSSRYRSDSRVSYTEYYDSRDRRKRRRDYDDDDRPRRRRRPMLDRVVVNSRREAEAVLDEMQEIIDKFEFARVSDLYETIGLDYDYAAKDWGWTSVSGAKFTKLRGGEYEIIFPEPEKY